MFRQLLISPIKRFKFLNSEEYSRYCLLLKGNDEELSEEELEWILEFEKKNKKYLEY